ncbi:hypothetical protein CPB86DRAFT_876447 [Serendipita vermifera]|nr:hypothetical protein CPB86DRAFT_876447 [Serendipita vermifera]
MLNTTLGVPEEVHQPSTPILGYMMRGWENKEDFYSPIEGHRYLEIFSYSGETEPEFREGTLKEGQISDWLLQEDAALRENDRVKGKLWLLILPPYDPKEFWKLPLSKRTVQAIQDIWHVPNSFFRSFFQGLGVATMFKTVKSSSSSVGFTLRSELGWGWRYSLCIVHDKISQVTHVICMGLKLYEIDDLRQYLDASKALSMHPLFVPICIIDLISRTAEYYNRQYGVELEDAMIAIKTDIHIDFGEKNEANYPSEEVNFSKITLQLTSLLESCAGLTRFLSPQQRVVHLIERYLLQERTPGDQIRDQRQRESVEKLAEEVSFTSESFQSIQDKNRYLTAALKAQVQTVYSLTSQRDNDLNLKISRLAARQNQFNMIVASATRRDSIDMRVIAGVTLVFLPGTFVATVFSSSFWNFQPPKDGRVVSSWIWLYCTVPGVLTFLVLALWRYLSRTQYKAMRDLPSSDEPLDKELSSEEGNPSDDIV